MNKNFFENMQEQIEPSEQLVSSLRTKLAHERASKRINSFMKFLPLTAAACILIAVCVIIFPMIPGSEHIPEGSDIDPPDTPALYYLDFSAPLTPQGIENLTDEEFLDMFMNGKFIIPDDIYIPDDFGVPLDESENAGFIFLTPVLYTVGNNHFAPVECVDSAMARLTNQGTVRYRTLEFIGENNYYFAFHTTDSWVDYKGESMSNSIRWLVPRDSAMAPHESEYSGFSIRMLDKQSVTDILDAWLLSNSHRNLPAWATVLYRSVEETDDSFIYTYYTASRVTYSEDEIFARLAKNRFAICKSTGWFTDDYYDDDNVTLKELRIAFPGGQLTPQEIEKLTDEEFLDMFMNGKFIIPDDIYIPDDFGVPLLEDEWYLYHWFDAHTAYEVYTIETAGQLFKIPGRDYGTLEFIGENEYYFAFRSFTSWFDHEDEYQETKIRWLVAKSSAVSNSLNEEFGHYELAIQMLDKDSVTKILDFMFLSQLSMNRPDMGAVLYRSIEELENRFIYTYYTASRVTYSEDEVFARLAMTQFAICKSTGGYAGGGDHEILKELPLSSPNKQPALAEDLLLHAPDFILPISAEFGVSEWHWEDGGYWGHSGLDFGAPFGTEIYAVADGFVTLAGWFAGYGFTVIIEHENGLRTWYAQCSALNVEDGQEVTQGDVIAFVGSTGRADGNHLHFEVRIGNEEILNPRHFLGLELTPPVLRDESELTPPPPGGQGNVIVRDADGNIVE